MNKILKLIIIAVIIIVYSLFISGLKTRDDSKLICDKPYIQVGTGCCLDKNDNRICDKDENKVTAKVVQKVTEKKVVDKGDFKIVYKDSQKYAKLKTLFENTRMFDNILNSVNKKVALPNDININFLECGEANAFYQENQITMCYELIEKVAQTFTAAVNTEEELDTAMRDTTSFLLFHEIGHALIDVLHLPTTGKEEDTADQLATWAITDTGEEGEQIVLNAVTWFYLNGAKDKKVDDLLFWDQHSLNQQRFSDITCLVYGKNPKHSYLVEKGILKAERAVECTDEYQRINKSFNILLKPYLK